MDVTEEVMVMNAYREKVSRKHKVLVLIHRTEAPSPVVTMLNMAGYQTETLIAEDKYDFIRALLVTVPDLIIADGYDPATGLPILEVVKHIYEAVPFLVLLPDNSKEKVVAWKGGGAKEVIRADEWELLPIAVKGSLFQNIETRVLLTQMRVFQQIRANIEGLNSILSFMEESGRHPSNFSTDVCRQIETSLEYLHELQEKLRQSQKKA